MKKYFFSIVFCLFFFSVFAESLELSIDRKPLCLWILNLPVWNEQTGPCPLGEIIYPERKGLYSSYVAYDSASDDASWIEDFFSSNELFNVSSPVDFSDSNKFDPEYGNNLVSRHITDSSERLSFFLWGDEVLSVNNSGLSKTVVLSDSKKIIRKQFDSQIRLIKKEIWNKGKDNSGKPETVQTFTYGTGEKPLSSEILSDTDKHILKYNESGKVLSSENYKLYKKNEKSNGRYYMESRTEWAYNDKGKIITKSSVFFEFNKIYTELKKTFYKKEVFEYKVSDSVPDYYYYEDNVLRLSTIYSGEDSYITTMNFDDGFVVESVYVDGKRKKDIYYLNGSVRRTKVYE